MASGAAPAAGRAARTAARREAASAAASSLLSAPAESYTSDDPTDPLEVRGGPRARSHRPQQPICTAHTHTRHALPSSMFPIAHWDRQPKEQGSFTTLLLTAYWYRTMLKLNTARIAILMQRPSQCRHCPHMYALVLRPPPRPQVAHAIHRSRGEPCERPPHRSPVVRAPPPLTSQPHASHAIAGAWLTGLVASRPPPMLPRLHRSGFDRHGRHRHLIRHRNVRNGQSTGIRAKMRPSSDTVLRAPRTVIGASLERHWSVLRVSSERPQSVHPPSVLRASSELVLGATLGVFALAAALGILRREAAVPVNAREGRRRPM